MNNYYYIPLYDANGELQSVEVCIENRKVARINFKTISPEVIEQQVEIYDETGTQIKERQSLRFNIKNDKISSGGLM